MGGGVIKNHAYENFGDLSTDTQNDRHTDRQRNSISSQLYHHWPCPQLRGVSEKLDWALTRLLNCHVSEVSWLKNWKCDVGRSRNVRSLNLKCKKMATPASVQNRKGKSKRMNITTSYDTGWSCKGSGKSYADLDMQFWSEKKQVKSWTKKL